MSSQSRHLGRAAIAGVSCSAALATTLLWPGTATADTSRLITRFYESEGAATALFDPTGQRLYVPTLNAVDVFNIPASRLAYSIKISDVPHDATLSRNGKRLYFTSEIADTVSAIDLVKRRTISTTHVCKVPTALVVSPTGTRVYTACGNGAALAVIDPKIHTMTGKILTGLRPESVAITADGSRVFIANEESNSISVVDTRKS